MRLGFVLLVVSAAWACRAPACSGPREESFPAGSTVHFDVLPTPGPADREILAAERSWEALSAALRRRPSRCRLLVCGSREDLARLAGSDDPGLEGYYRRGQGGRSAIVVVYAGVSERVIRHEVAHHFILDLLGPIPDWLNEGLAEHLESLSFGERGWEVEAVAPDHVRSLLDPSWAARRLDPEVRAHRHTHYPAAWAVVAALMRKGKGDLAARVEALKEAAGIDPVDYAPGVEDLLDWVRCAQGELADRISGEEGLDIRSACADLLGRVGARAELLRLLREGAPKRVAAAAAGALARLGDFVPLRKLLPEICCHGVLQEVSRAAGRRFGSVEELAAWVEGR